MPPVSLKEKRQPQHHEPSGWEMPAVEVGDIVNWFADTGHSCVPQAAMVTAVGSRSIHVNIFDKEMHNLKCRDGVCFRHDPERNEDEANISGTWEFTEAYKRIKFLEQRVNELSDAVLGAACKKT